jgi:hypothetical protein
MSFRRGQHFWALAILLLVAGVFTVQASSLLPDHSSDHASHCCAVCHLAHLPLVKPAQVLSVLAPALTAWFVLIEEAPNSREFLVSDTQPRAPPLASVSL